MSKQSTFRLRWKGVISEPLSLGQISDKLRSGEISLIHNIEVEGSWITIREYFRTIGLTRSPVVTASQIKNQESVINPPEAKNDSPNKNYQPNLEHIVRMGYLWCGSTFIFPLLFSLIVPILEFLTKSSFPFSSRFVLLSFGTLAGCGLPYLSVRHINSTIQDHGLSDIVKDQQKLYFTLATSSALIWLIVFWILAGSKG
jgi:hypothetical protein